MEEDKQDSTESTPSHEAGASSALEPTDSSDSTENTKNASQNNDKPREENPLYLKLCEENQAAFDDKMTPSFTAEQGFQNLMHLLDESAKVMKSLSKSNEKYAEIAQKFLRITEGVMLEEEVAYKASRKRMVQAHDDEQDESASSDSAKATSEDAPTQVRSEPKQDDSEQVE